MKDAVDVLRFVPYGALGRVGEGCGAALDALEDLVRVAAERELREHGPGCRCSLARALSAIKETESSNASGRL